MQIWFAYTYMLIIKDSRDSDCIYLLVFEIEAFAVCENYSPPEEGFNPRDLHRLLEKVGSPSGGSDLGKNSLLLHIQDHKLTCAVLSSTLSDYSFLNKKLSPEMVNLTFLGKTNSYFYCSSLLKESAVHDVFFYILDTLQIAAVVGLIPCRLQQWCYLKISGNQWPISEDS